MKAMVCLTACLLIVTMAFSVDEDRLEQEYRQSIRPYYDTGNFGKFAGANDVDISYVTFEKPDEKGALVIVSGKSDAHVRYAEFLYDIRDWGYSVYIMDHRGMGQSGRLLDDPEKTYVDKFENYVKDLETFIQTVVMATPHEKLFIFSHSMGGIVTALYLAEHPGIFDAAVFNAPLFGINTGGIPAFLASALTGLMTVFGGGSKYALGQGPWQLVPFEENTLTHSEARYKRWEDTDISENPEIKPGGATNRWVRQSFRYSRKARRTARRVDLPILLIQAEEDAFITERGLRQFSRRAPDSTKVMISGTKHLMPIESDPVRTNMLAMVKTFYEEQSSR